MIVNLENINVGYTEIPNNWKTTENKYNTLDSSVHFADGFRTVVEPIVDTTTQRKGTLYYDSILDIVTYHLIEYTQEELSNQVAEKEENENKKIFDNLTNKGNRLYTITKKRLIRKGEISKKVREILHPCFAVLVMGDIDIANDIAMSIAVNSNPDVEAELVWFKNKLMEINNLL